MTQLPAKYYLFLKQGITCSANNCKDLVSGKSGNHTVKYVTPIFKYLFISLMIVSGVPAVTKLESFHILFLPNIFVFLLSNSPSSAHLLEQMVPYNQNNHQAFPLP
jgi:flagellar biosynthesis protein FliQ